MVKIKLKLLLLSVLVFVLLVNIAFADSKLIFSDVDVKVGGKTDTDVRNGDRISEEAKPGDTIEFRVKVQNNFTTAQNLKIKDITVKVTIEGIDDGSDLEEESNSFDLSSGSDRRVTLKFEVPLEVDESVFDVLIHAEGEDKNGTNHESEMRLKLEVTKKSHLLKITKELLNPAEVSCNRKNIRLDTTVINIGNEDEDDVIFQVLSPTLGVDLKDNVGELSAEPNEPESRFSRMYTFNVPSNLEAGSYPITLRALYDNERKKAEDTLTLTVNDCLTKEPIKMPQEEAKAEEVELITPTGKVIAPVIQSTIPPGTTVTQEGLLGGNAIVVGVIMAEIFAVVIGILLVGVLFRKKG